VGCGPGTITTDLARLVAPGRVIGIDRAPEVVAHASAEVDPAVSLLSFLSSTLILGVLTIVTWLWLGGKDDASTDRR